MSDLFIGLMSGTSLDGADAVLVRFAADGAPQLLSHQHQPFGTALRAELLALNSPGDNEAHRCALAANGVAQAYATLVRHLLAQGDHKASEIRAIGAHGQTIRHRPGEFDGCGYTLQLLNGALLAELSNMAVVCDLRSRDVAAGGQGAPLVPAFHRTLFGRDDRDIAVLNIGGISNISLLSRDGHTTGFDCGPGNCLMDFWVGRELGQAYDAGGAWAATGQVLPELLQAMLAEPFFQQAPPRSTGRDLFNPEWLAALMARHAPNATAHDVQATLLELTAASIAQCLREHGRRTTELLVCGGGALNTQLMQRLQILLPTLQVMSSDARGLPAMQVEAAAFAWLAQRFMQGLPGNLAAVTGAAGPRILGALYPA
jgi:anhydro-N-acetylmuramic acid kinase